jgi:acetylornithine deacetylase
VILTLSKIDEHDAYALLADLISIDSVNPSLVLDGAGEQRIAEYVRQYLDDLGLSTRLDEVAPGRPNVVGLLTSDKSSEGFDQRHGLMINGHLDTVGTSGMEIDPLKAVFEGDKVFGRGAFDMKGGLAMGLLALAAIKRSPVKLNRSVLFTGVVDEEYASIGTENVAKKYSADAAVILEPTNLGLCVAHKGFAWVSVETFGRAAHGSSYQEGIDAIANMGKLIMEVNQLGKNYLKEPGHSLVGPRSIHWSLIQGGKELSTYPDYCKARLERRTLPGEDPASILEELKQIYNRLSSEDPQLRAKITLDFIRKGYEIDRNERIVRTLASLIESNTGIKPKFTGSGGWMDSAILGAADIPTVLFGPSGEGAHAGEEWVSFSSIVKGATILAQTILEFCK